MVEMHNRYTEIGGEVRKLHFLFDSAVRSDDARYYWLTPLTDAIHPYIGEGHCVFMHLISEIFSAPIINISPITLLDSILQVLRANQVPNNSCCPQSIELPHK